jgi:hypothetical protein
LRLPRTKPSDAAISLLISGSSLNTGAVYAMFST